MRSYVKLELLHAVTCANIPNTDEVLIISTDDHRCFFDLTHTSDLALVSIEFETVVIIVLASIELISMNQVIKPISEKYLKGIEEQKSV